MRLRVLVPVGAAAVSLALVGAVLAGTAQAAPTPSAAPNAVAKADILKTMKLVDDYWVAHGTDARANNWQNSTFHVGNLAFVTAGGVSNHVTRPWAQANKFAIPTSGKGPFFPDNLAPGEVYLDLLPFHPDTPLTALRGRVADETKSVQAGHVDYVNYVDGLNMALPSFARLGVLDRNESELAAMQKLFTYAEKQAGGNGLFNETDGLWWRDKNYVHTRTYWSRGNGWAIMAMAKLAEALPAGDPRRSEFIRVLVKMAATLKSTQRTDGFWNVDLGNPNNFPGPETSGTAFFTYGIAWGVNHGVLPAAEYRPVVEKAWQGMVSKAVASSGRLGYVQGPGAKPSDAQPVKATDTAAYAVGGFLLAGSELAALSQAL
jgi:unsaturated rhamnogalacturonyl hydrolase